MTEELNQKAEDFVYTRQNHIKYFSGEAVKILLKNFTEEIVAEATKELQEENEKAKEIIRELSKYVSDSKWYVQNGYVKLQKELVAKAEAFLKE